MSEASDDAQLPTQDEVAPQITVDAHSDADDVEVLAQAPAPEVTPVRHDSVSPTSRKLAPPPKPKRDSSNPASSPPPAADGIPSVGSLKAPSAPSINFQDASASARDAVTAALTGSDSLRAIGEALAQDAGAFSTSEAATGGRPTVPRPRSQPTLNALAEAVPSSAPDTSRSAEPLARSASEPPRARDKVPTVPDEPPAVSTASPPKSGSIFAQRIISVGTPSDRPPPRASSPPPTRPKSTPPPKPLRDLDITVEIAPEPVAAEPVAAPPVAAEPVAAPPIAAPPIAAEPIAAPPTAPEPIAAKPPSVPPLPAVIAVGIAAIDIPLDEAPPDIPITTDTSEFDEDTPPAPAASPMPFESPAAPAVVEVVAAVAPPPIPAFLAAATGVVAFAGAYQATLAQGAAEQAAFQVPLAATVTEGPDLNQPLAVATADQFAAAGG
ncbi:MAG: hypothetical protein ABUL60_08045, partial [Myxococcales bacterium]